MRDFSREIDAIHAAGGRVCVGSDPLALLLVKTPGAMGADIAVGSAQRFGVPLGFGGPHAAFMAVRDDLVRMMPGRIIGVSRDAAGNPALRMALQTREQHIRRDKATSNICTAQALLANMAAFYAVYHGPDGLLRIALRVNAMTRLLCALVAPQRVPVHADVFDTVVFDVADDAAGVLERARAERINLRLLGGTRVGVSLDETVTLRDVADLAFVLSGRNVTDAALDLLADGLPVEPVSIPVALRRTGPYLTHPVFHRYRSETDFVRYLKRLENRDLSLVHSMIPLGSCTMKLNAASEMAPLGWSQFADLHPFVPAAQAEGYAAMLEQLGRWLAEITGFSAVSFQPNSGAQGEYAGLLAIRNYLAAQGQGHRDVCLIPASAHGTNPATAQMMGMRIVVVACDADGNVDLDDLRRKLAEHRDRLAALMITYPSTHGVFESTIVDMCRLVHAAGGQVYMDGANLNAQAGLTGPGHIGADVCHMNLHKTFCIPHGGGGPGMGPIGVAPHLAPFLPDHPVVQGVNPVAGPDGTIGAVSAAPWGSASILPIVWAYIALMGAAGLKRATQVAILNANYIAQKLSPYYPVLYTGKHGRVAHECIVDLRPLKDASGVTVEDVAKRLMDYGFHAPTVSFPVPGTLMIEPTESENRAEIDRFCDAMIAIRAEIADIEAGRADRENNLLKHAPHTHELLIADEWTRPYSRRAAFFPSESVDRDKYWPPVARVDNVAGDRNLICTCPPLSDYARAG